MYLLAEASDDNFILISKLKVSKFNPAGNYMFKLTIETLVQGVKYV